MPRPALTLLLVLAACGERPQPASAPDRPTTATTSSPDSTPRRPAPTGDSTFVGDPPTLVPGPLRQLPGEWTIRTADVQPAGKNAATLRSVRTGTHDGFDRAVFVFDGEDLPGVHMEYVDRPVRACGSGAPVALEGDAWLEIRFQPARAHTEAGAATLAERRQAPAFAALREWALTCDFEADVTVALGVAVPAGYRTAVLRDPLRLAVDVRHGR